MTAPGALPTLEDMSGEVFVTQWLTKRRSVDLCRVATCLCR